MLVFNFECPETSFVYIFFSGHMSFVSIILVHRAAEENLCINLCVFFWLIAIFLPDHLNPIFKDCESRYSDLAPLMILAVR